MAFYSEIYDQLRDLLNDPTDAQVPFATKRLYVNRAINLMWPRVYRVVEQLVNLTAGLYEYTLAVGVMDGYVMSVELAGASNPNLYSRFSAYDIIPGDEDQAGKFKIAYSPTTGDTVRIRYVAPVAVSASTSYATAQSEFWDGPNRALGLPVLYAMGMITARKLDDRQDTSNYNTNQALNGVDDRDIIALSQMWLAQFELELDNQERPLPPARD